MIDCFPPGSILLAGAILLADDGRDRLPCPRVLAELDVGTLLDLMEAYLGEVDDDSARGRAAAEAVLRIGTGLAHRLGIHCVAYISLMCERATASDWRYFFPEPKDRCWV